MKFCIFKNSDFKPVMCLDLRAPEDMDTYIVVSEREDGKNLSCSICNAFSHRQAELGT